jgi:hypothetical protein
LEPGTDDTLRPPRHFLRRATRERKEQDALGLRAGEHKVRHAMGEGVGFAGAGARDDQQRARSELRGFLLFRIQLACWA